MKRVYLAIFAAAAVLFSGCSQDSIETTEQAVSVASDDSDPTEAQGPYDSISQTSFSRTITISWSGSSASVEGDEKGIVSVSGSRVTADSRSSGETVKFILKGTSTDGDLTLYGNTPQALVLNGLQLESSGGPAINNQSHKRTFVVLEGSNELRDAGVDEDGEYPYEDGSEDMKAAFFSEGQLVFSGSGSLSVSARGKAAITSDDYLRFLETQSITATSVNGHALRGKDAITVDNGTITASTSADGKKAMTSDGTVTINGGTITLTVSGGTITETADGVTEYTGSAGIKSDGAFSITGGRLKITSSGTGGKGISGDSTGSFSGGTIEVSVTGTNYGSSSGARTYSAQEAPGGGWGPGGNHGGGGQSSSLKSAKGIKFDGDVTVSGGSISVSASGHEAFEAKGKLTVTGGTLYAFSSSDDAINSGGDMSLAGGLVCGWSTGNDAIDANGNLTVEGATVYAVCTAGNPEVALDANTEQQKTLYLKSGALVAVGGIESGASISGSAYSATGWSKSGWHSMYDNSGDLLLTFKTPASSGSGTMVLYSSGKQPELKSGVTVSGGTEIFSGNGLEGASVSGGSTVSVSTYSSNSARR